MCNYNNENVYLEQWIDLERKSVSMMHPSKTVRFENDVNFVAESIPLSSYINQDPSETHQIDYRLKSERAQ